jgi:hypothetical protein
MRYGIAGGTQDAGPRIDHRNRPQVLVDGFELTIRMTACTISVTWASTAGSGRDTIGDYPQKEPEEIVSA